MMHTYTPPWSKYSIEVGYEPIVEKADTSNFLKANTAETYLRHVVMPLNTQGQVMKKTASIFAWPLAVVQEWGTKDISNHVETSKIIGDAKLRDTAKDNAKSQLFLVFSEHAYNYRQALNTYNFVHHMAAHAQASLTDEEIQKIQEGVSRYKLNTKAYGMWTMDGYSLGSKYDPYQDARFPNVYVPKPEALRVMAEVNISDHDGLEMPCSWGNFRVRNGGHVAITITPQDDEKDGFQQFQRNMQMLEKGDDAFDLFLKNSEQGVLAKLDIYGIEPGFVVNNYQPIPRS